MALTKSQQKAKIDAIDKKIAKNEKLVGDIEALRAERAWYEQAPTVADRPKVARKTKAEKEAEAAAKAAEVAPASA